MLSEPIFYVFGKGVYMYGLCIAIGLLACIWVFCHFTKKKGMPTGVQNFALVVAVAAIALGFVFAKLYQAIYDYIETPSAGFDFAGAGFTAMGGFIGGAAIFLAAYFGIGHLYFKKKDRVHLKHFNTILRVAPICIVIAHAFGRIGCLMSGCCHGALLSTKEFVVGGIWMRASDTGIAGFYVPTQLYEALFLFGAFAILTLLYFKGSNITMQLYLISYGVWRIIIEVFRTDARGAIVLGLAPSQWQSIIFIVGGVAMLLIYKLLKKPFVFKDENQNEQGNKEKVI